MAAPPICYSMFVGRASQVLSLTAVAHAIRPMVLPMLMLATHIAPFTLWLPVLVYH